MISYHMMFNLCKMYKGFSALKMYPTWEKSDHGELSKIAKKYGKDFNHITFANPSGGSKRMAADDIKVSTTKRRTVATYAAPTAQVEALCKISRSAVNTVPLRKAKHASGDTPVHEVSDDSDEVEEDYEEQSDGPSQKEDTNSDTPPKPKATVVDVRPSSPVTTSEDDDFRIVWQSPAKRALTREEVEERA